MHTSHGISTSTLVAFLWWASNNRNSSSQLLSSKQFLYRTEQERVRYPTYCRHVKSTSQYGVGKTMGTLYRSREILGATDRTSRQSIDYCNNECVSKLWAAIYCCRLSWGSWTDASYLSVRRNTMWSLTQLILAGSSHPCHTVLQLQMLSLSPSNLYLILLYCIFPPLEIVFCTLLFLLFCCVHFWERGTSKPRLLDGSIIILAGTWVTDILICIGGGWWYVFICGDAHPWSSSNLHPWKFVLLLPSLLLYFSCHHWFSTWIHQCNEWGHESSSARCQHHHDGRHDNSRMWSM